MHADFVIFVYSCIKLCSSSNFDRSLCHLSIHISGNTVAPDMLSIFQTAIASARTSLTKALDALELHIILRQYGHFSLLFKKENGLVSLVKTGFFLVVSESETQGIRHQAKSYLFLLTSPAIDELIDG